LTVCRIHVRRTDKVGAEAAFHSIDEYMMHVEDYYDTLEKQQHIEKRRVYIASDDSSVISDAKRKYVLPLRVFLLIIAVVLVDEKCNSKKINIADTGIKRKFSPDHTPVSILHGIELHFIWCRRLACTRNEVRHAGFLSKSAYSSPVCDG